jgi:hypothetical protein
VTSILCDAHVAEPGTLVGFLRTSPQAEVIWLTQKPLMAIAS